MIDGVSVVICCYNSAEIIELTLDFLQKQETHKKWEVILVNNASSDNTSQKALAKWGLNPVTTLEVIYEDQPGLSFARQTGIAKAKYEVISFVDDDNLVPENWITSIHDHFNNPEVGLLGVSAIGRFDEVPPDWYERHKLAFATGDLYDFTGDITELGCVYGAGMSIRKKIYQELKAKKWKPQLTDRVGNAQSSGGDTEICMAAKLLGYKVYYDKDLVIQHYIKPHRITLERLYQVTEGFGAADVLLLAYEIAFREKIGKPNQSDSSRQSVFFNYTGKLVASLKLWMRKGSFDPIDYRVLQIRNKAFSQTLLANKISFIETFNNVSLLQK